MRTAWAIVLALSCCPALDAEESAPPGYEFQWALSQGKVSVAEMLLRLKAGMPGAATKADRSSLEFCEVFATAIKGANGAEFDELGKLLHALPADSSYEFDECFSVYVTARIRQRVAQMAGTPMRLEWQPTTEAMPKELADAPAAFGDSWKLFRTVVAPYLAIVRPPEAPAAPRKKLPALEVDLRRVLGKPEPEAWKQLSFHVWGGWCGTGSEMLYHPRNRALLLSFLADGKLREAAGAALAQVPSPLSPSTEDRFETVAVDLLTALGLDWEAVMFGSLLPVGGRNMASGRPVVSSGFGECDAWQLLAARGSERAVRQCLELIRWANLDPRDAGEFLSTALKVRPAGRTALPDSLRSEAISVFAEYLAPTNKPADLINAMGQVPAHCVKELRVPLAALVSHRVHAVAAKAHSLLQVAGLTTGDEKIAPATPPLHFRMLLNGKPLNAVKLSIEAIAKRKPAGSASGASEDGDVYLYRAAAPTQELTSDENSELWYSLEDCLEPERMVAVEFRFGPSFFSYDEDDTALSGLAPEPTPNQIENEWPGPWIIHQVEVRAGDPQLQVVELTATDLEVKLTAFPEFAADTPMKITLRRVNPAEPESGVAKANAKAGGSAFFRRLQPGKYSLQVTAPGAALYDSGEFTVGSAAVTHEVKLEPGRNVRGTAVLPGGERRSFSSTAELFRDGVGIPNHGIDEWKGLSFGKYTARSGSTREWEELERKAGRVPDSVPQEDRRGASEVSFVIDASTPATLDLGEIIVPAEKP